MDSKCDRIYHNSLAKSRPLSKYEAKFKRLKRVVRETVFTNAAICDEVVRLENKVARAKEERKYLLRRLLQQQAATETVKLPLTTVAPVASTPRPAAQSIAQLLGEVDKRRKKASTKKKPGVEEPAEKVSDEAPTATKATKKARPNQTKRRVTPIPLDNSGRPIFPIELGLLTIYCLGEIVPLPGYFTAETIYPIGFCSTRQYVAISKNASTWLYTCKISDGGNGAKFEILPEETPGLSFVGYTPSHCHQQLLEAINLSRGPGTVPVDPKGPEFFGLSHPTVQNLIQSCPGARKCSSYRWTKFEVSRNDSEVYAEEDASVNLNLMETSWSMMPFVSTVSQNPTLLKEEGSEPDGPSSLRTLLMSQIMK